MIPENIDPETWPGTMIDYGPGKYGPEFYGRPPSAATPETSPAMIWCEVMANTQVPSDRADIQPLADFASAFSAAPLTR